MSLFEYVSYPSEGHDMWIKITLDQKLGYNKSNDKNCVFNKKFTILIIGQRNHVHLMKWMVHLGIVLSALTGTMQKHSNVPFVTQEKGQLRGYKLYYTLCIM